MTSWDAMGAGYVVVHSAANPVIKRIRRLGDRKHRSDERAFVVEGVQPVQRALRAGAPVEMLVIAPQLVAGTPAEAIVAEFETGGGAVVRLTAELFARISTREGPTGVAAIVGIEEHTLGGLAVTPRSVFVALHRIANPGNLGTIVRTADSFGADGVILLGPSADPYAPTAIKASMGSLFAVPVVRVASSDELLSWSRGAGLTVITTSARASTSLLDVELPSPSLVLLGNEGAGLPADLLAAGEQVRIPMLGSASSLNLAVAAGIVLYEAARAKLASA